MLKLIQLIVLVVYLASPVVAAAATQETKAMPVELHDTGAGGTDNHANSQSEGSTETDASPAIDDGPNTEADPSNTATHADATSATHDTAHADASPVSHATHQHAEYECSEMQDPYAEILGFDMGFESINLDLTAVEITTPLRAQIDELKHFTPSVRREVYEAIEILNRLFASEEFNQAIENYKFNGRRQFAKNLKIVNGRQTNRLTNKDIYKLIHLGREERTAKADATMNLRLHMVGYLKGNTVAETNLFAAPIAVNKYKYMKYDAKRIAANMMHEWLHNMGFSHSGLTLQQRSHSVPYAIGAIVQKLAPKYQ